jgi:hypothetical protein
MSESSYDVNFFSPRSEAAIANKKVVSTMLLVWFVAVFGFQFLLAALNKPVPEPMHAVFPSPGLSYQADQQRKLTKRNLPDPC